MTSGATSDSDAARNRAGARAVDAATALGALLHTQRSRDFGPVFVGLDGRSGAGKTTLAAGLRRNLSATGDHGLVSVIDGDDFYAGGSPQMWDRRSLPEMTGRVIDWRRQRWVLRELRSTGVAHWHPFDWDHQDWDGAIAPLRPATTQVRAESVVVLEGTYSCRPELHDLLDLRVLLQVPAQIRHQRHREREGKEGEAGWRMRWTAAEDHYFATVMPPERFDIVLGMTPHAR